MLVSVCEFVVVVDIVTIRCLVTVAVGGLVAIAVEVFRFNVLSPELRKVNIILLTLRQNDATPESANYDAWFITKEFAMLQ